MVVSMEEVDLKRITDAVIKGLWPKIEALMTKSRESQESRVLPPPQAIAPRPLGGGGGRNCPCSRGYP